MIGALSFGGGYGMISLVRETVLGHGWLSEGEFLSFIAVSESTPGPAGPSIWPPSLVLHRRLLGRAVRHAGVCCAVFCHYPASLHRVLQNLMKYCRCQCISGRGAAMRGGNDPGNGNQ